jgi:hypothetical protein
MELSEVQHGEVRPAENATGYSRCKASHGLATVALQAAHVRSGGESLACSASGTVAPQCGAGIAARSKKARRGRSRAGQEKGDALEVTR